jgi:hypothetical protein
MFLHPFGKVGILLMAGQLNEIDGNETDDIFHLERLYLFSWQVGASGLIALVGIAFFSCNLLVPTPSIT